MAKEATSTIAANKEVSIEELASQLATLKNDIAELTGAMTNFGKTRGRAAADQAKSTAQAWQIQVGSKLPKRRNRQKSFFVHNLPLR